MNEIDRCRKSTVSRVAAGIIATIIVVSAIASNSNTIVLGLMPTDLNGDGTVNILDLATIAISFGLESGDPQWNPDADLNADGVINILDISYVATDFGKKEFKAALILFGAALDGSWNEFWYNGAMEIMAANSDISIDVAEFVYTADYERVARSYGDQGYDLLIATTADYQDAALSLAPDYPDMIQVIQTGWINTTNVAPLNIWPHEGAYLAGMLAAYMSTTGKIGVIGYGPWPSQIAAHEGFMAGAAVANPDIEVSETFTYDYTDTAVARSATIAMIDADVDAIFFSISGMAFGGIPACEEYGKLAIGSFLDMNYLAPETVITTVIWQSAGPIMGVINDIRDGTFDAIHKDYSYSMTDAAIDIAPYHYFEGVIPENVKAIIADTREAILNGTLVVPLVTSRGGW